jgi:hypothetical protein
VTSYTELGLKPPEFPSDYQDWNEALAEHFFARGQTQAVYLDPDTPTLNDMGALIGVTGDAVAAFVAAVKETLLLVQPGRFLHNHDEWFDYWRHRGREGTPPFVGLLALFSYAATHMEDDRAYYRYLAKLLGVTDIDAMSGCYNRRVRHYWIALNRWIESERRGIPTAYPQNILANVSLLLTQRFLSSAERALLPGFFRQTGLVPGTSMTVREMLDHITRLKVFLPEPLHNEWARHSDRFAEVCCIELEAWTGEIAPGAGETQDTLPELPLRLGLYFDRQAEQVSFPLATSALEASDGSQFFFEGDVNESDFIAHAVSEVGGCMQFDRGEAVHFSRGARLSPAAVSALLREEVSAQSNRGVKLRRRPSDVVIFTRLSGRSYIEERRAPVGTRFAALVTDEVAGSSAFQTVFPNATSVDVVGSPGGWSLYRDLQVLKVPDPSEMSDPHRALLLGVLPSREAAVVAVEGGVAVAGPTRAGRAWLASALPQVMVSTEAQDVHVHLHARALGREPEETELELTVTDAAFHTQLPRELGPGDHQIFVTSGRSALAQRRLRVVSAEMPRAERTTVAHRLANGWSAVSAEVDADGESLRGASWRELRQTPSPLADIPSSLGAPLLDDEHERPQELPDLRPDRFKKRRGSSRRPIITAKDAGASSLATRYATEIRSAVSERREAFEADGKSWRIKYFPAHGGMSDEIVVKPAAGFVPLERYAVSYESGDAAGL